MTLVELADGGGLASYAGAVALRATVLLLGALVVAAVLRGASAAARHALWSVTLGALVVLPLLPLVLPGLSVSLPSVAVALPAFGGPGAARGLDLFGDSPAPGRETGQGVPSVQGISVGEGASAGQRGLSEGSGTAGGGVSIGAASPVGAPEAQAFPASASTGALLLLLWAAGASLLGALLGVGLWRAGRLTRQASRTPGEGWRRSLERARREVGLRRPVSLGFSPGVRTPMAGGVLRPVVLLPEDAREWTAERREIVLLHELVHVKRADPFRQVTARVALALYWFHPLTWLALRAATLAREEACDEAVVSLGRRPSTYARHLVALADADTLPVPALSRLHRPPLERRIMTILRPHVPRRGWTVLAVAALAVTWALAVAMVGPDEGPQEVAFAEGEPVIALPTLEVTGASEELARHPGGPFAAPGAPSLESPAMPAPDPRRACRPADDGMNFQDGRDFGPRDAAGAESAWTRGDRFVQRSLDGAMLCIRTHGGVVLAAGGARTASLSVDEGSWVVLAVRGVGQRGDRLQRMEIVAGADGPEHTWFVDGQERPFDEEARQWRDAMLAVLGTHLEITRLRAEEARLRGAVARERGEEARRRGEVARIRGEEARLRGEMARARGQEARHRGEVVRLRGRIAALEGARRATESEETRERLSSEVEEIRARLQELEAADPHEEVERAVAELQDRLEIRREEASARIREIEAEIAGLDVSGQVRELEARLQELDAQRRIQAMESGMEAAVERLRAVIERAW